VLSLSGISSAEHVRAVQGWGADGMLVGESLMLAADPAAKARELRSWAA
jgi:indole-3-glycerol phosphate synthase